jgi:hypothetical protein
MPGQTRDMSASPSLVEAPALPEPGVRRLGERTCLIEIGTELRHTVLPELLETLRTLQAEGEHDYVFDLCDLRRYEPYALVRLARQLDRLSAAGDVVHIAASGARASADLRCMASPEGWVLHESLEAAMRELLTAPV